MTKVWHLSYLNIPLKLRGIVVYDTEQEARAAVALLEKWETFRMSVSGPHDFDWGPE